MKSFILLAIVNADTDCNKIRVDHFGFPSCSTDLTCSDGYNCYLGIIFSSVRLNLWPVDENYRWVIQKISKVDSIMKAHHILL